MAHQQPAKGSQPGEGPLHLPTLHVTRTGFHRTSQLGALPSAPLVRGDRRPDALRAQPFPQAPAVGGLVGDQLLGTLLRPPLPRRGTRTDSSVPTASFTSWWLAPANSKPIGRPLPSAASISLVPLPRLVFPTARPPFGRDEAAVEEGPIPLEVLPLVQQRQQTTPYLFPGAVLLPRLKPPPARRGGAVLSGHVFPAAPGA